MIRNYIITAFRNFLRNKVFTLINIFGLAVSMACSILILLWVHDELKWDKFHENKNEIYKVICNFYGETCAVTHGGLGPAAKEEIPEIIDYMRYIEGQKMLVADENNQFYEKVALADPGIFKFLDFKLLQGDPEKVLINRNSIVISEYIAEKFFSNTDPICKSLKITNNEECVITGVMKNIPNQSEFQFDLVRPFIVLDGGPDITWEQVSWYTYLLTEKNINIEDVNNKIDLVTKKYLADWDINYYLYPITRSHLYSSHIIMDVTGKGNVKNLYTFGFSALFILIIACINFINLSTARSSKRAMEVSIRKVCGAGKRSLIKQFLGESFIQAFISLQFAIVIVEILRNWFNTFTGKDIYIDYGDPMVLVGLFTFFIITGGLAGLYPAIYLSTVKIVKILKGGKVSGSKSIILRRILIISQFSLTIIFLVGSIVIWKQLKYIENSNHGFNKNNIIYFRLNNSNHELIKDEIEKIPGINQVSAHETPPPFGGGGVFPWWEGKPEDLMINMHQVYVDEDYVKTYQMEMAEGRFFDLSQSSDTTNFVLNETAAKKTGLKDPIGKRFAVSEQKSGLIIGIIEDFQANLNREVESGIFIYDSNSFYTYAARIDENIVDKSIIRNELEKIWNQFNPDFPFEFFFLEDTLYQIYSNEQKLSKIFQGITILSIIISCLGLFGLSIFISEQRIRELGVRKVLGATVPNIAMKFSLDFIKWIIVAFIIAAPVSWYIMDKWLRNFNNSISFSWWFLILGLVFIIFITLLTVSIQAIKSANNNPVKSLRYE